MSVTRSEIINKLAKNFPNIYKKDINKLFDIFLFEVLKALSNSERVELRDVMTFEPRIQKKRVSLNPKTLEKVEVPEKKTLYLNVLKNGKKELMKKYKIFIACDTTKIKKVKEIINKTQKTKIKIGYKFGLEFINSKLGRKFIAKLKNKIIFA